ncbi:MAG: threonine synthase [Planctomycetota bacterium]
MSDRAYQQCIDPNCAKTFDTHEVKLICDCGSLLDVRYDWDKLPVPKSLAYFEHRWASKGTATTGKLDFSGVWRFRELMPYFDTEEDIVSIGEGRTILQNADLLADYLGMPRGHLQLQYEGLNPSGSFKDNGMTAAFTHARMIGAKKVACASTGNTSASLAMFASFAEMDGIVFIGSGKIAFGKLSQALDYGATTLQISGDFDACLRRVRQVALKVPELGIYLMNSVNPFRLEGQKSIMFRILEARDWQPPDWIIVPGGNLGNCSAFGKAFVELKQLGLIEKIPRLAIINASGADTLSRLVNDRGLKWMDGHPDADVIGRFYGEMNEAGAKANTVASAIEIGRPVNLPKALRALDAMDGVVRDVTDEHILEARAAVARFGFGCEPASAASVAGLQVLKSEGVIGADEQVVCILTGHELKDANATVKYHTGLDMKAAQDHAPKVETHGHFVNVPEQVDDDLAAIVEALGGDPSKIPDVTEDDAIAAVPVKEY